MEDLSFDRNIIDAAVKQYLHRMVICLEHDMLPATPRIVVAFTKVPNPALINDFMPLLTQMVNRFKVSKFENIFEAKDGTLENNLFFALFIFR